MRSCTRAVSPVWPQITQCFPRPSASGPQTGTVWRWALAVAGCKACIGSRSRRNWNRSMPVLPILTFVSNTPGSFSPPHIWMHLHAVQEPVIEYRCRCALPSTCGGSGPSYLAHSMRFCSPLSHENSQENLTRKTSTGRESVLPSRAQALPLPCPSGPETSASWSASGEAGWIACSRSSFKTIWKLSRATSPRATIAVHSPSAEGVISTMLAYESQVPVMNRRSVAPGPGCPLRATRESWAHCKASVARVLTPSVFKCPILLRPQRSPRAFVPPTPKEETPEMPVLVPMSTFSLTNVAG
mmetsp:Transcript_48085/g.126994  ORF Transcript_48085/g.126994 Transcript_48085/m.126994 type:complete len:299 (+) Transcript_48085:97-993(+)